MVCFTNFKTSISSTPLVRISRKARPLERERLFLQASQWDVWILWAACVWPMDSALRPARGPEIRVWTCGPLGVVAALSAGYFWALRSQARARALVSGVYAGVEGQEGRGSSGTGHWASAVSRGGAPALSPHGRPDPPPEARGASHFQRPGAGSGYLRLRVRADAGPRTSRRWDSRGVWVFARATWTAVWGRTSGLGDGAFLWGGRLVGCALGRGRGLPSG